MNITFRYLELLNAVVVSGSISKATRLTKLSQPTISQQLAKFEEELGTQLIYRKRGQNVELTPAGELNQTGFIGDDLVPILRQE